MKKTITLALLIGISAFIACKKKETKTEDPAPTPAPAVFGDGFKMEDNLGNTVVCDSSYSYYPTTSGFIMLGFSKGNANIILPFKTNPKITTYPLDSLNTTGTFIFFGNYNYPPSKGSITISALSTTKISGTFIFTVTPGTLATQTRTLVTGTFNNIKIK